MFVIQRIMKISFRSKYFTAVRMFESWIRIPLPSLRYHFVSAMFNSWPNQNKCTTAQKMKLSIKDFFSKCDQICRKLRIWSRLLTKSLMENFIFWCSVPICFIFYNQKATPFGKVTRFVLFKWMLLCFIFIKNKKYTFTSLFTYLFTY